MERYGCHSINLESGRRRPLVQRHTQGAKKTPTPGKRERLVLYSFADERPAQDLVDKL